MMKRAAQKTLSLFVTVAMILPSMPPKAYADGAVAFFSVTSSDAGDPDVLFHYEDGDVIYQPEGCTPFFPDINGGYIPNDECSSYKSRPIFQVAVRISEPVSEDVSFRISYLPQGTASPGVDFSDPSVDELTIPAGETESSQLSFYVWTDGNQEADETIVLGMQSLSPLVTAGANQTLVIKNDDAENFLRAGVTSPTNGARYDDQIPISGFAESIFPIYDLHFKVRGPFSSNQWRYDGTFYLNCSKNVSSMPATLSCEVTVSNRDMFPAGSNLDIKVQAIDVMGNVFDSTPVSVTIGSNVDDTIPTFLSGSPSATPQLGKKALVTWNTSEPTTSRIRYWSTAADAIETDVSTEFKEQHSVTLTDLKSDRLYRYIVYIQDAAGNPNNTSTTTPLTFRTLDETPPSLNIFNPLPNSSHTYSLYVSGSASDQNMQKIEFYFNDDPTVLATISSISNWNDWFTTINIDSWDSFGTPRFPDGSYTLKVVPTDSSPQHNSTTYSIPININNPPVIVNVSHSSVHAVSETKATISWNTPSESGTSVVDYRLLGAPTFSTVSDAIQKNNHQVLISGLVPGQRYQYRAKSIDSTGKVRSSILSTFDTVPQENPTVHIDHPYNAFEFTDATTDIDIQGTSGDNIGVARVDIYYDGEYIGSVSNPSLSSSWSWTYENFNPNILPSGFPVEPGQHYLQAVSIDIDGHNSGTDPGVAMRKAAGDSTAPSILIGSPSEGQYVASMPNITGTARDDESGLTSITVFVNGTAIGSRNTGDLTSWNFTWDTSAVSDGTHQITAKAVNGAGTDTTTPIRNVTLDRVDPVMTINTGSGQTFYSDTSITGLATDSNGVASMEFRLTGGTVNRVLSHTGDSSGWSVPIRLADVPSGTYTFTATAYDRAGNDGVRSITLTLSGDSTAPTITVLNPIGGTWQKASVMVRFSVSDNSGGSGVSSVELRDHNNALVPIVYEEGEYRTQNTQDLASGLYTYRVNAWDNASNPASKDISIRMDRISPVVVFTNPSGGIRGPGPVSLSFSVTDAGGSGFDTSKIELIDNASGSKISILRNGDEWETQSPINLVSGNYSYTARAQDIAGNASNDATISFTVDSTAPSILIGSPSEGQYVASMPNITGTARDDESGLTSITVFVNGTAIGSRNTGDLTSWNFTWDTSAVSDGTHQITAKAVNGAGTDTTTPIRNVTLDRVDPVMTINTGSGQTFYSDTSITGLATDSNGVASMEFRLTGGAVNRVLSHTGDSSGWSVPIRLADVPSGTYTFTATAYDRAGNDGVRSITLTLSGDSTPPTITVLNPTGGAWQKAPVMVRFSVSDNSGGSGVSSVELRDHNNVLVPIVYEEGEYRTQNTQDLASGLYTYRVNARDNASNPASKDISIRMDRIAPVVAFTNPSGGIRGPGPVSLSFSVTDAGGSGFDTSKIELIDNASGSKISILRNGDEWETQSPINLVSGNYSYTARAQDIAGNASNDATISFSVDSTAPTITVLNPTGGAWQKAPVMVRFKVSDNSGGSGLASVVLRDHNNAIVPIVIEEGEYRTVVTQDLPTGSYTYQLSATDNVSLTATANILIRMDRIAPAVSFTDPIGGIRGPGQVNLEFRASDAHASNSGLNKGTVELVDKDEVKLDLDEVAESVWQAKPVVNLTSGNYTFKARIRDNAGNASNEAVINFTVDASAPSILIDSPSEGQYVASMPNITGTSRDEESGLTSITVYVNGTAIGSRNTGDLTSWNFTWDTSAVLDGPHRITAKAVNGAGTDTTTPIRNVTLDRVDPVMTINTGSGQTFYSDTSITGLATDSNGVASMEFRLTGGAVNRVLSHTGDSSGWSVPIRLADVPSGTYTFTATAYDRAGNDGVRSITLTLSGDSTAPTITVLNPIGGTWQKASVMVRFSVSDNSGGSGVSSVELRDHNNALVPIVYEEGEYRTQNTQDLASGLYTYRVNARDNASNPASKDISIRMDRIAPVVAFTNPSGGIRGPGPVSLSFSVTDAGGSGFDTSKIELIDNASGSKISILRNGDEWETQSPINLVSGNYSYTARAQDIAGNASNDATISFTVDGSLPSVSITSPGMNAKIRGLVQVVVEASDVGNGIKSVVLLDGDDNVIPGLTKGLDDRWRVSLSLSDGEYILKARATDNADLTSVSSSVRFFVDNTVPSVSIVLPAQNAPRRGTFDFHIDARDLISSRDRLTVTLEAEGLGIRPVTVYDPGLGVWMYSWNSLAPILNGTYNFTARAVDEAGNSATSAEISVRIDNVAPVLTFFSPSEGAVLKMPVNIEFSATDVGTGIISRKLFDDSSSELSIQPEEGRHRTVSPYPAVLATGDYSVRLVATDDAGNETQKTLTFSIDATLPTVSISSPREGDPVSPQPVLISGAASDNRVVSRVDVEIDGAIRGAATGTTSWEYLFDFSSLSGPITIRAKAIDVVGNEAWSAPIHVTVQPEDRTAPMPMIVKTENINDISAVVYTKYNEPAKQTILLRKKSEPASVPRRIEAIDNLLDERYVMLDGLTPETEYVYSLEFEDAAGNFGVAGQFEFTTDPYAGLSVGIRNLVVNQTLTGTYTLEGFASDTTYPIDRVEILVEKKGFPGEILEATLRNVTDWNLWKYDLNTLSRVEYSNGQFIIKARVFNNFGYSKTYSIEPINFSNDLDIPTLNVVDINTTASTADFTFTFSEAVTGQFTYTHPVSGVNTPIPLSGYSNPRFVNLTGLDPNTLYSYRIDFADAASHGSSYTGTFQTKVPGDGVPPVVSITLPTSNTTWPTDGFIEGNATDNVAVAGVEIRVDGRLMGTVLPEEIDIFSGNWIFHLILEDRYEDGLPHVITATAIDPNGNSAVATVNNIRFKIDMIPPGINLRIPDVVTTHNSATFFWDTTENATTVIRYRLRGSIDAFVEIVWPDSANPEYVFNHQPTVFGLVPNTEYDYEIESKDRADNVSVVRGRFFKTKVAPDTDGPVIQITDPQKLIPAKVVSGIIRVGGFAFDVLSGMDKIELYIDSQVESNLLTTITSADWTNWSYANFDTTRLSNGSHTIFAKAYDRATNTNTDSVTVNINNSGPPDPDPLIIVDGSVEIKSKSDTSATIQWLTNRVSNSTVRYGTTEALEKPSKLDPTMDTRHSVLLDNLTPSTRYYFTVVSEDGSGQKAEKSGFFFDTLSGPDLLGPEIKITRPSVDDNETTISGLYRVSGTAIDNVQVGPIEIYVVPLSGEIGDEIDYLAGLATYDANTLSWTFDLNTLSPKYPNDFYMILARAYDDPARNWTEDYVFVDIVNDGSRAQIDFLSSQETVREDAGEVNIDVRRTGDTNVESRIRVRTESIGPNGAIDGTDYEGINKEVVFPANDKGMQTVKVKIHFDGGPEPDKKFRLVLSDPVNATVGANGTYEITIDDVALETGKSLIAYQDETTKLVTEEAGRIQIPVKRLGPDAGRVVIEYDIVSSEGQAVVGDDYTGSGGTLTWEDGDSDVKNIDVTIVNDSAPENDETFRVVLLRVQSGDAIISPLKETTIIIQSNDGITPPDNAGEIRFSDVTYTVNEDAGTATITVLRLNPTEDEVTVSYRTEGGTASDTDDYDPVVGVLTFGPGDHEETFTVNLKPDSILDGDKTVGLILWLATNGAVVKAPYDKATLNIQDDDGTVPVKPSVDFLSSQETVREDAGEVNIDVRRTGDTNVESRIRVRTESIGPNGAIDGTDYEGINKEVVFPANDKGMQTVKVKIHFDGGPEPDKKFRLVLSDPVNATVGANGTYEITIDDVALETGKSLIAYQDETTKLVTEEAGRIQIPVKRLGPDAGRVVIEYDIVSSEGQAVVGDDYTGSGGTLTWEDGDSDIKNIDVTIVNDSAPENDETFRVVLLRVQSGDAIISPLKETTIIIQSNDGITPPDNAGEIRFSDVTYTVNEDAGTATITVLRLNPNDETVTVSYRTEGGTASTTDDYDSVVGVLSFGPTDREETFTVNLKDDFVVDGDKTVGLVLSAPSAGAVLDLPYDRSTIQIIDNDSSVPEETFYQFTNAEMLPVDALAVNETADRLVVYVTRSGNLSGAGTIQFSASSLLENNATEGDDYVGTSGTLSFDPNQSRRSFVVTINPDSLNEGPETLSLILSDATNGTVKGANPLLVTINDVYTPPPGKTLITFDPDRYDVLESVGTVPVVVKRKNSSVGTVTVRYEIIPVSATLGDDFTVPALIGELTWADGESSDQTIDLNIVDDSVVGEPLEWVRVVLSDPRGSADIEIQKPMSATVEIEDNDVAVPSPQIRFTNSIGEPIDRLSVLEDAGNLVVFISRTGSVLGASQIFYSATTRIGDTASVGLDFEPIEGSFDFAVGETLKSFSIPIRPDLLNEGPERFSVLLDRVLGATIQGTNPLFVTIDDVYIPPPGRSVIKFPQIDFPVDENQGTLSVTIKRENSSIGNISAQYKVNLLTADALDVVVPSMEGTLSWPDGDVSDRIIQFNINDDFLVEPTESFEIVLSNPTGPAELFSPAKATVQIFDNDSVSEPTVITFANSIETITESEPKARLLVTRSGDRSKSSVVSYITSDVSALVGQDYAFSQGTLSFGIGVESAFIDIPLILDPAKEPNESFQVTLSNPVNAVLGSKPVVTVTIQDIEGNVSLSDLEFSASAFSVDENQGKAFVTVRRSGSSSGVVSVSYVLQSGTARHGEDFLGQTGILTWADREMGDRVISIDIIDDAAPELDETVFINLQNPQGNARIVAPGETILIIRANDQEVPPGRPGTLQFSGPAYVVDENGDEATITVVRLDGSEGQVKVSYATSHGSAQNDDYVSSSGELVFEPGQFSKTIIVRITDDTLVENNETVLVKLSSPTNGAILGTIAEATLTINDNDGSYPINGALQFGELQYAFDETSPFAMLSVNRVGGASGTVTVRYRTVAGSAVAGDFTPRTGILTFMPGDFSKVIPISINDDEQDEPNEIFQVELLSPSGGAVLGIPSSTTVIIIDNDGEGPVDNKPGVLQFVSESFSVSETEVQAVITVSRVGGTVGSVSVSFASSDGSATAGQDYESISGVLEWSHGDAGNKTFAIKLNDDTRVELVETIVLDLFSPTGGAKLGAVSRAIVGVTSDDIPDDGQPILGSVRFAHGQTSLSVEESKTVDVLVERVGGQGTISVRYEVLSSDAQADKDFISTPGLLIFTPGQTTKTVQIKTLEDSLVEGPEKFIVRLKEPTEGVTLIDPIVLEVRIIDNETSGGAQDSLPRFQNLVNLNHQQSIVIPFVVSDDGGIALHEGASVQSNASYSVSIEIFNLRGEKVRTVVDSSYTPGPYTVTWDGRNNSGDLVSADVYLLLFKSAGQSRLWRKLIIVR